MHAFRERVKALGIPAVPYINQSNGGTMSIEEAARVPVRTALSGPSAGVAGAAWIAARAGFHAIATFDMGGTSTDVSFVRDGAPALAFEREIGGITLRVPTLDIHTVGAGGGSIAWRDSGGALKVGPRSAGADPGPACYGRGGEAPTVTDANLLLGRLSAAGLLGGALPLDRARAEAVVGQLGAALGLSVLETARGIVRVVNANMANAVRVVTVQRGIDPAGLVLVPFGGAGPLHAGELARELGIRTLAVPPGPGLLCALGLLVEDLRTDAVRTFLAPLEPERFPPWPRGSRPWSAKPPPGSTGKALPRRAGGSSAGSTCATPGRTSSCRWPCPDEVWRAGDHAPLRRRFLATHEQVYGFAADSEPMQVVNARLVARGLLDPPDLARLPRGSLTRTGAARAPADLCR